MKMIKADTPAIGTITPGKDIYAGCYLQSNRFNVENGWSSGPVVEKLYNVFVAAEDMNANDPFALTLTNLPQNIAAIKNYHGHDGAELEDTSYPLDALEKGYLSNKWFLPSIDLLQKYVHPLTEIASLKKTFELVARPDDMKFDKAPSAFGQAPVFYEDYERGKRRDGVYLSADVIPEQGCGLLHFGLRMESNEVVYVDKVNPACVRLIRFEPALS